MDDLGGKPTSKKCQSNPKKMVKWDPVTEPFGTPNEGAGYLNIYIYIYTYTNFISLTFHIFLSSCDPFAFGDCRWQLRRSPGLMETRPPRRSVSAVPSLGKLWKKAPLRKTDHWRNGKEKMVELIFLSFIVPGWYGVCIKYIYIHICIVVLL